MRFRKLRWTAAALIAFVMGVPMAERVVADDGGFFAFGGGGIGGIVGAALALASSIVDTAGGS